MSTPSVWSLASRSFNFIPRRTRASVTRAPTIFRSPSGSFLVRKPSPPHRNGSICGNPLDIFGITKYNKIYLALQNIREAACMTTDYKYLYFRLFGKISDMVEAVDIMGDPPEQVLKQVRSWLIQALQEAEEAYLNEGETPENQ